jgi:hypothetical protein
LRLRQFDQLTTLGRDEILKIYFEIRYNDFALQRAFFFEDQGKVSEETYDDFYRYKKHLIVNTFHLLEQIGFPCQYLKVPNTERLLIPVLSRNIDIDFLEKYIKLTKAPKQKPQKKGLGGLTSPNNRESAGAAALKEKDKMDPKAAYEAYRLEQVPKYGAYRPKDSEDSFDATSKPFFIPVPSVHELEIMVTSVHHEAEEAFIR